MASLCCLFLAFLCSLADRTNDSVYLDRCRNNTEFYIASILISLPKIVAIRNTFD